MLATERASTSRLPAQALSAQRLHALALESFRIGNRGRLSLSEALRVLAETRLYFELGYPSVAAYADAFFQLRRTETFEYVRVAQALVELTELSQALAEGRISWSAIRAITRVAKVESQSEWIEFARLHGIERTLAEARDALRRGTDRPRKGTFGLPNLDQKLVFRFSRSEMERVRKWIDGACALAAEKSGAEHVSMEQALLFLCEARNAPCGDSKEPRAQVVYQRCPDCRRNALATTDGLVEVSSDEVERHEGCAEPIVIDGPTPPTLRRKVLAREGGRCGNPRCRHLADHCHHIVFRSRGGSTDLANEVAVCTTCHALVHAGLLRVEAKADGELSWASAVSNDVHSRAVEQEGRAADQLPVLHLEKPATREVDELQVKSEVSDSNSNTSIPAEACDEQTVEDLAAGLTRLGFGATHSREMVRVAYRALPREQWTEQDVLRAALRAG